MNTTIETWNPGQNKWTARKLNEAAGHHETPMRTVLRALDHLQSQKRYRPLHGEVDDGIGDASGLTLHAEDDRSEQADRPMSRLIRRRGVWHVCYELDGVAMIGSLDTRHEHIARIKQVEVEAMLRAHVTRGYSCPLQPA